MTPGSDRLVDAEERGRAHPETFEVLPTDLRASLAVGDLAQLCFDDAERLWVEVARVSRRGDQVAYHGKLRSVPLVVRVKLTDVVRFEPRNVLRVERYSKQKGQLQK